MKDKGKLAESRRIDSQLPETPHLRSKLLFCFVSLTVLCISAVAEENAVDYWMNKAEEFTHNDSSSLKSLCRIRMQLALPGRGKAMRSLA